MRTLYNRIAGQSLERLAALSDGLFAIAMTLLILDIHVPDLAGVHSELELWQGLVGLAPRFVMFLMSFLTLGIFWSGQQTQFNHFARADRDLAWIHIAFLATISTMPFSTMLLAEYIHYRVALLVYWFNILVAGAALYASLVYACRAKLLKEGTETAVADALLRRILIAQGLYALGAALCYFGTSWSIGFIVLVQLNYAIAPRLWWRRSDA
jgi:uncharacterized membrane protein